MALQLPAPTRIAFAALLACATAASAETVDVTIDAGMPWVGFVNVFERPNTYAYGFFLENNIAALPASVAGNVATLAPNSIFGGSAGSDTLWWDSDGSGGFVAKRLVEANVYVDTGLGGGVLSGKTVRFTGTTLASSLAPQYVAIAFIRSFLQDDYTLGYAESSVQLEAGRSFELTRSTTPGHPVQYGFALVGPNADPADFGLGSITISAVPEPATPALLLLGAVAMLGWMRRQR